MRLSVQLYTLREDLGRDLVGTLRAIREIGFDYVELAGTYGKSAGEFRELLDKSSLKVSGGHWGLEDVENVSNVAHEAEVLDCGHVVLPWVPMEAYTGGWVAFGKRLEPTAKELESRGLTFSYHNHAFEFDPAGPGDFATMWEETDPAVKAQLDLGWLAVAGEDPATWLDRLGKRAKLVHLKDFSGNAESHDAIAGKGKIDWKLVVDACERNGVQFGTIEMDRPPEPALESVAECFRYFQSLGLA